MTLSQQSTKHPCELCHSYSVPGQHCLLAVWSSCLLFSRAWSALLASYLVHLSAVVSSSAAFHLSNATRLISPKQCNTTDAASCCAGQSGNQGYGGHQSGYGSGNQSGYSGNQSGYGGGNQSGYGSSGPNQNVGMANQEGGMNKQLGQESSNSGQGGQGQGSNYQWGQGFGSGFGSGFQGQDSRVSLPPLTAFFDVICLCFTILIMYRSLSTHGQHDGAASNQMLLCLCPAYAAVHIQCRV